MNTLYEVIMFSERCPDEVSSFGIFTSEELAVEAIESQRKYYSEDMVFDIIEKMEAL